MGTIKTFRELNIWEKGIKLVKEGYGVTEKFPGHELYGITSQMRQSRIHSFKCSRGFRQGIQKNLSSFLI
jgi:hypothetical protein